MRARKARSFTPEEEERIKRRIRERGLTFEVFLPEGLADWLRAKIADGTYESAREAAFVAFTELQELEAHPEVRLQLLKAKIQAARDDPTPPIPGEEVFDRLDKYIETLARED
ncbi:hypothetical protein [Mesorhizobium sp. IMUNJ 23232]|uniref:antitoxin PaaA2 family protein n=1 Tax=Mesorhizobium sp. IMUNJ 23232 TaxID=3376064 RepID=UPI0037A59414